MASSTNSNNSQQQVFIDATEWSKLKNNHEFLLDKIKTLEAAKDQAAAKKKEELTTREKIKRFLLKTWHVATFGLAFIWEFVQGLDLTSNVTALLLLGTVLTPVVIMTHGLPIIGVILATSVLLGLFRVASYYIFEFQLRLATITNKETEEHQAKPGPLLQRSLDEFAALQGTQKKQEIMELYGPIQTEIEYARKQIAAKKLKMQIFALLSMSAICNLVAIPFFVYGFFGLLMFPLIGLTSGPLFIASLVLIGAVFIISYAAQLYQMEYKVAADAIENKSVGITSQELNELEEKFIKQYKKHEEFFKSSNFITTMERGCLNVEFESFRDLHHLEGNHRGGIAADEEWDFASIKAGGLLKTNQKHRNYMLK